jgi:hypothetical protein
MRLAGFLAVVLLMLCACSTTDAPRDEGDQNMPVSAQTAAEFGDVTLPPAVEVLGTDTDSGRDTRYRLALRMTDAQLGGFLGQFSETPRPSDIPKSTPVIAGPELSAAPDPRYAQDQVVTAEHGTVTREIIIVERTPDEVYVHLSLYTT